VATAGAFGPDHQYEDVTQSAKCPEANLAIVEALVFQCNGDASEHTRRVREIQSSLFQRHGALGVVKGDPQSPCPAAAPDCASIHVQSVSISE